MIAASGLGDIALREAKQGVLRQDQFHQLPLSQFTIATPARRLSHMTERETVHSSRARV